MARGLRGQPLLILLLLLLTWVGARATTWTELPGVRPAVLAAMPAIARPAAPPVPAMAPAGTLSPWPGVVVMVPPQPVTLVVAAPNQASPRQTYRLRPEAYGSAAPAPGGWFTYGLPSPAAFSDGFGPRERSPLLAPMVPNAAGPGQPAAPVVAAALQDPLRRKRWSGDSWVLVRDGVGGTAGIAGPAPSVYGAGQTGAVLRYALSTRDAHRPDIYLRVTGATDGSSDTEAALGLAARPIPAIPVAALAEVRVARLATGIKLRPAAMAVTQLPPLALPLGLRGEAYLQGGYVAGAGATAFVDGQLRVDRSLLHLGTRDLRIGAAGWGGAQRGATRLDFGPAATVGVPIGRKLDARLAVDYRIRVAGNAEPGSGPALTLSAGF